MRIARRIPREGLQVLLLEPSLFYDLSIHYNRVQALNERFWQYTLATESLIVSQLSEPDLFYGSDGALLPQYLWQMQILEEIASEIELLVEDADELREKLQLELG